VRIEQLADDFVGQIIKEVETGQRPEWKEICDRSCIYKSCWIQWNFVVVRDGGLKRHKESADGTTKTFQMSFRGAELNG
jgi:hypothetical protein